MAVTDAIARFSEAAAAMGLDVEIHRHPQGTRTAADAAAAVGCTIDQIVKSIVVMADDEPVLVLCAGSHRVDLDAVGRQVGAGAVRMATPDEVRAATGYAIGGTPPVGHPRPLPTLVDPRLTDHAVVYAAAGTPDAVFAIDPARLANLGGAVEADICG